MSKKVALIKGDGVGPELSEGTLKVMEAAGTETTFIECEGGAEWWEREGGDTLIPEATWEVLKNADACFKGPTTTPGGEGTPKSVAVSIRQAFDLYANVRPIRSFPNTNAPLGPVNFLCIREATEGFYYAAEEEITDEVLISIRKITVPACRKIARFAYEEARRRKWKTVVAIHKSNILKRTCGAFLKAVEEVGKEYEDIELWTSHVDDIAQQLIKNPQQFNEKVLLSTNLFMDILSEECAGLIGSIGVVYSANIGDTYAMFEPAHGSAAKYKGQDRVNPTATLLSGAWLLSYLGEREKSARIFRAVEEVIAEGNVTYDLGGSARTSEMIDAVVERVSE